MSDSQYNPHNPSTNSQYNPHDPNRVPPVKPAQQSNPWFTKPTNRQQWTEHVSVPLATRSMSAAETYEFRDVLAMSYRIQPNEVFIEYEAITNVRDEERHDCMYLLYKINVFMEDGRVFKRTVYTLKVPIPANIKEQREAALRKNNMILTTRPINDVNYSNIRSMPQITTLNTHSIPIPQLRKPNIKHT